jgi:acyl carrier protein
MTMSDLRSLVLAALEDANAYGLPADSTRNAFLSGEADIEWTDFELDSLAMMKFCIELEKQTGTSIAPRTVVRTQSLGELVEVLADSSGRPE